MRASRRGGLANYRDCNPDAIRGTSNDLGWAGLTVNFDHFLRFERTELCYSEHHLCFNFGRKAARLSHGSGRKTYRGHVVHGDFLIMPAGMPFHWCLETESDALSIRLTPDYVAQVALREEINPDKLELHYEIPVRNPFIAAIGKRLHREIDKGNPTGRLFADMQATSLALLLLHDYSSPSPRRGDRRERPSRPALLRVGEYIRERPEESFKIAQLADMARMKLSSFAHQFTMVFGMSPIEFRDEKRIEWAKRLIDEDRENLAAIASRVGYSDQRSLARKFKEIVGMAPSEYRDR